jgi:enamine deaminase RidA (YjgF/YER057c/UK114 family)
MSTTGAMPLPLGVSFGAFEESPFLVSLDVLGGPPTENVFRRSRPIGRAGDFVLFEQDGWLLGRASLPVADRHEATTRRLYDGLLAVARRHHLARIWNYVPRINEPGTDGLENYRAFCRGRSLAFEAEFGPGFTRCVPAASAVGSESDDLVVVAAASPDPARHFENPWQVPAYEYPPDHGPRPPSFARATVAPQSDGTAAVFISGTAAIRGHASVAPEDTERQIDCTLANLEVISRACGLGSHVGRHHCAARHAKVYIRHAEDYPRVAARFGSEFSLPTDRVTFLRADICRKELNVEIEVSVIGARLESAR